MKINYYQLVNQDGNGYGFECTIVLDNGETYEDGKKAMMRLHGLDWDDDEAHRFVSSYGTGWDQFRWRIINPEE